MQSIGIGTGTGEPNRYDFDTSPETADVYVTDRWENRYGDERVALGGDTYEAKDVIKFEWDTTHHSWNGDAKQWEVDAAALDKLEARLAAAGFTFNADVHDPDSPLFDLHEAAEEGQQITVEYLQKNREGTSEFSGTITHVGYNSGWEDRPQISFERDDGQGMYVQFDKQDRVALYTHMSHAPFVGHVQAVTVEA